MRNDATRPRQVEHQGTLRGSYYANGNDASEPTEMQLHCMVAQVMNTCAFNRPFNRRGRRKYILTLLFDHRASWLVLVAQARKRRDDVITIYIY